MGSVRSHLGTGSHDTEVDDLEVVAPKDNTHNVLANVVDVTLDRRENDRPAVHGALRRRCGVNALTLVPRVVLCSCAGEQ
jgi:hypothetical protein